MVASADTLRDTLEITKSISKMCKLIGMKHDFDSPARKKILKVAADKLGLKSLDENYKTVGEAAKSLGMGASYFANNKILSKFAHPTAGLVVGIMHQTKYLRGLQIACTTFGANFAGECVFALERAVQSMSHA